MSEIINETINELDKPTQNNVFSIEDDPVTVLEKINQVERYLKQIDTRVDTSINTANEAMEKANTAFEANGTLVKINGENQLTWSADFAESERQKSKNLFGILKTYSITRDNITIMINSDTQKILINGTASSSGTIAFSSDEIVPISVKNGEYFTISKIPNVVVNVGINNKENPSGSIIYVNETDKFNTNTIIQNDKANRLYFWYDAGDTFNNVEFGIQVEYGSVATDYQPYNGQITHNGDPAVEFAESERQKSKNLLDINKAELKANSQTHSTLSNGTLTINNSEFSYISSLTNLCDLKPNIPYTLSYVTNNGYSYIYQYYDGGTGFKWNNGETKIFSQVDIDRIADNLLLFYGSTNSTVTYSNIQIEEGSTATDYQPYNGAIVHEAQIADVEHIETIYDMSSSDANINQGKTSGVQFNTSNTNFVANATTSKYGYFYVYVKLVNQIVCVKMKSGSNASIMAQNYAESFGTLAMGILMNSNDVIYAHDIRSIILPSGSFTTYYDNPDYVITKVEGVLL